MKHRTLVADDEESARSGLASLLSTCGYDVELAAGGKDALDRAAELQPSVLIADLVMPGMDEMAPLKPKNNKTRAAAILGTTPKTLHNKARRWRCAAAETAGS